MLLLNNYSKIFTHKFHQSWKIKAENILIDLYGVQTIAKKPKFLYGEMIPQFWYDQDQICTQAHYNIKIIFQRSQDNQFKTKDTFHLATINIFMFSYISLFLDFQFLLLNFFYICIYIDSQIFLLCFSYFSLSSSILWLNYYLYLYYWKTHCS